MTKTTTQKSSPPSWWILFISSIYPLGVIIYELVSKHCAATFFDPMPTFIHTLLVLTVPLGNGLIWLNLRFANAPWITGSILKVSPQIQLLISSACIGVAGYYTLIFLPLTPIALIAIIFYGLGFLALAPLISCIYSIKLYLLAREASEESQNQSQSAIKNAPSKWRGLYLVLLCFLILDIPATSTHLALKWATSDDAQTKQQGINMLRYVGDEDILLRLSYDTNKRSGGIISYLVIMIGDKKYIPVKQYRQIFYQVTGTPFNQHPLPYIQETWRQINNEAGGSIVGRKAKGLSLVASTIDSSVNGDDGVGYSQWSMTFENETFNPQEARMQIALPPGSVVSRATLWVNGEPQEAAFGKREQVRQAYESVVRTNRDPLLVTTVGSDRILAQAFPIPAGGTLKFRLGITTPLTLQQSQQKAQMTLPAIIAHNFQIKDDLKHLVWIESKTPIELNLKDSSAIANKTGDDNYRIHTQIANAMLSNPYKLLSVERDSSKTQTFARYQNFPIIKQSVSKTTNQKPEALILLVDGSIGLKPFKNELTDTIKTLDENTSIGLIIANTSLIEIPAAPASGNHKDRIIEAINEHDFVGGQDNAPAIAQAILALESSANAQVLWIHAPQPVLFENSQAQLEQVISRLKQFPKFSLYSVTPGINRIVESSTLPKLTLGQNIPQIHGFKDDIGNYLSNMLSPQGKFEFVKSRAKLSEIKAPPTGSDHIARLWAFEQVNQAILTGKPKGTATNMAINYQLVTPLSGAVVLENAQQYEDNDLTPVEANTVPTIPEPHQWMLAFILLILMLWFLKHNKLNLTKAP